MLAIETLLSAEVLFIDIANIRGHDRLIFYQPGILTWFDPESQTLQPLVEVVSDYAPPANGPIQQVEVARDPNGNGLDDMVMPDGHGFNVFVQKKDGSFASPVNIGPSSRLSRVFGAEGIRYDPWPQGRVHQADYNRDGRSDLVYWNEDHFEVHYQDEQGLFKQEPRACISLQYLSAM